MAIPSSSKGGASRKSRGSNGTLRKRRVRAATANLTADFSDDFTDDLLTSEHGPELLPEEDHDHPSDSTQTVSKSLIKFIVGLFLLPLAWVLTETFLQAFATSVKHGLLASQSFGCFAAGAVLFGVLFLIIPHRILMIPYVLGHEVTHALWVWIFGGKVADQFHVSMEGGHVLTDRVNTWIVLAPYFFPIYSLLVVTIYGAASLVADLNAFRWVLFLALGITLAFHLVFTCLLIIKGQPDLHYGGTFFSLMVIYLINLMVIMGLLLATSRIVSVQTFAHLLETNAVEFLGTCRAFAEWLIAEASDLYTAFVK
jgi:hypothetical protein